MAGVTHLRFRSANFDHIRALVRRGVGYALMSLPMGATPDHWHPDLCTVPVQGPVPRHQVTLATIRCA